MKIKSILCLCLLVLTAIAYGHTSSKKTKHPVNEYDLATYQTHKVPTIHEKLEDKFDSYKHNKHSFNKNKWYNEVHALIPKYYHELCDNYHELSDKNVDEISMTETVIDTLLTIVNDRDTSNPGMAYQFQLRVNTSFYLIMLKTKSLKNAIKSSSLAQKKDLIMAIRQEISTWNSFGNVMFDFAGVDAELRCFGGTICPLAVAWAKADMLSCRNNDLDNQYQILQGNDTLPQSTFNPTTFVAQIQSYQTKFHKECCEEESFYYKDYLKTFKSLDKRMVRLAKTVEAPFNKWLAARNKVASLLPEKMQKGYNNATRYLLENIFFVVRENKG